MTEPLDPDELVDDVPVPAPRRRSVLTGLLVAGLLLAAGFVGGVLVQKSVQGTAGVPVLTGIVQHVSGNVLDVADSSGSIVTVTVPDDATVTTRGLAAPALGTPVAVTGDRTTDGGIIATTVTVRPYRR